MTRASKEAVTRIDGAAREWAATAADVAQSAMAAVTRLRADAESEVHQRAQQVRALEAALASARDQARGKLARDLQAATESLTAARRGLQHARALEQRAHALHRRMTHASSERVPSASSALRRKHAALERYEQGLATVGRAVGEGIMTAVTVVNLAQAGQGLLNPQSQIDDVKQQAITLQTDLHEAPAAAVEQATNDQALKTAVDQLGHVHAEEMPQRAREENARVGRRPDA